MSFILKIIIGLCVFIFPPKVHAIVILPAVILVPLVKLIALVVGALSIPVGSAGVIVAKITKKYTFVILASVILILLIGIAAAIFLRITHPDNLWF